MASITLLIRVLLALAFRGDAPPSEALIPAGVMNAVYGQSNLVVIYEETPEVERYAKACHDQFFKNAKLLKSQEAAALDLSDNTLIVYGTVEGNAWLKQHANELPFRYEDHSVRLQNQVFEGEHLRVIATVRNPQNPNRRAVLYTAQRAADIVNIHDVFHGPTEWLVARGNQTLASGSYTITKPLTADAMRTDLDFLTTKIEQTHVSALNGLPPVVASAAEEARLAISNPLPPQDFWFVLCKVVRSLNDAHTSMGNLPAGQRIDLPINWLRGGIVVTDDTEQLRRGDRILAIGSLDESKLLAALRLFIPAENDSWVRYRAHDALTSLTLLQAMGATERAPVRVAVEREGEKVELQIPAGEPHRASVAKPWVRWTIEPDHNLAIFTLDTCQFNDHYRTTLREFFEAVHKADVSRIAIDVRANTGGNSRVVNEFLRYCDVDEYRDYTSEVRWTEDALTQRNQQGKPGHIQFAPTTRRNQKIDDQPSFAGKLFVLTSKQTFSSGNWFAVILQDNNLATVVGEPTGNAPSSFGDILAFTLPESGFSFYVSFKRWVRPDPDRDPATCITPDRIIELTRDDIVTGADPVLDALRNDAK